MMFQVGRTPRRSGLVFPLIQPINGMLLLTMANWKTNLTLGLLQRVQYRNLCSRMTHPSVILETC